MHMWIVRNKLADVFLNAREICGIINQTVFFVKWTVSAAGAPREDTSIGGTDPCCVDWIAMQM